MLETQILNSQTTSEQECMNLYSDFLNEFMYNMNPYSYYINEGFLRRP